MKRSDFIKKGVIGGMLIHKPAEHLAPFLTPETDPGDAPYETVLWEELTWPEIKARSELDAIVIIPVGSIEQHGPHLPVSTDILVSSEVSRRAAEIMNRNGHPVVVTPRVWTGNSFHHMVFPGTLSFEYRDFDRVLMQTCRCLKQHGFSRIVFVNGHGGNVSPLRVSLIEINRMLGRPAFAINYWDAAGDELREILDTDRGIGHSGEAETSIMLALRPELVRRPFDDSVGPDRPDPQELRGGMASTFRTYEDRTSTGVIGNAGSATREKGERILELVTENLAEFLERRSLWEITL